MSKENTNNTNSPDKNVHVVTIVREVRIETVQSGFGSIPLGEAKRRLSRIRNEMRKTFGDMPDIDTEEAEE